MDVIKYARLDISGAVEELWMAESLASKNPGRIEVLPYDGKDFVMYSYINIEEYKSLPRGEENKILCPVTAYFGFCDEEYLEENKNKPETLEDTIKRVELFHQIFKHPVSRIPKRLDQERKQFRFDILLEEVNEYLQAGTIEDEFDALLDIIYIAFGTIVEQGLTDIAEEGFIEVQRSNMSKLDANGQPIFREDGKILKSELYSKPALKPIIEKLLSVYGK